MVADGVGRIYGGIREGAKNGSAPKKNKNKNVLLTRKLVFPISLLHLCLLLSFSYLKHSSLSCSANFPAWYSSPPIVEVTVSVSSTMTAISLSLFPSMLRSLMLAEPEITGNKTDAHRDSALEEAINPGRSKHYSGLWATAPGTVWLAVPGPIQGTKTPKHISQRIPFPCQSHKVKKPGQAPFISVFSVKHRLNPLRPNMA